MSEELPPQHHLGQPAAPPLDTGSFSVGPIDVLGYADWTTIWGTESQRFPGGGTIIFHALSHEGLTSNNTTAIHAEVRLVGEIGGVPYIICEGVVGQDVSRGPAFSLPPLRILLEPGHTPDQLRAQVRARRGGTAVGTFGEVGEVLNVSMTARLYR